MIGGKDVVINTDAGPEAIEIAAWMAKSIWPNAIIEDAQSGEETALAEISLSMGTEFLVYRDSEARNSWQKLGAIPSLSGTLLHFILSGHSLTVVVDDIPTPQVSAYLQVLKKALRAGSLRAPAQA